MRPSIQDTMMSVAYAMSKRSTCSRRANGAVVATPKGVVLSTGYNGSLAGMEHCNHTCNCADFPRPSITDTVWVTDQKFHSLRCRMSVSTCPTAVHAEANAIYFAARNGVSTLDALIYCTTEPCCECAEAIVQAGISECWYHQEYRTHLGNELLGKAGVVVKRYSNEKVLV